MERSTRKSGKDILFGKGKSAKGRETLRERVRAVNRTNGGEKLIGAEEELIPFSWRYPLAELDGDRKMTKVYKHVVSLEKSLVQYNPNRRSKK
ncbi:MAG: hypothetical protein HFE48_05935 [Clostridia bacterium]|nr:hypothetical protein [Clostridia bacterium]